MIKIYATKYLPVGGFKEGDRGARIRTPNAEGVDGFPVLRNICIEMVKNQ